MRAHAKIYTRGKWVLISGDLRRRSIRIEDSEDDLLTATDALVADLDRDRKLLTQLLDDLEGHYSEQSV